MNGTPNIFDYAHGYLGYRPVPTQTEDRDAPHTSALSREEEYLSTSDENTSLLSDCDES